MSTTPPSNHLDTRIQTLTDEVDRLRKSRHHADNQLQSLMLKITEVQLNLAVQDKTLSKLDSAVNGNGRLGLTTRVDRIERLASNLTRATWLLLAAAVTTTLKFLYDHTG